MGFFRDFAKQDENAAQAYRGEATYYERLARRLSYGPYLVGGVIAALGGYNYVLAPEIESNFDLDLGTFSFSELLVFSSLLVVIGGLVKAIEKVVVTNVPMYKGFADEADARAQSWHQDADRAGESR
jgi:hypothetical protein